jgi:uncharacterized protein
MSPFERGGAQYISWPPISPGLGAFCYDDDVNPIFNIHHEALAALCQKHKVQRLGIFGSAVGSDFDPARSDLDLIVEFLPLTPIEHADAYFGLMDDLHALFGLPIDLIERRPITNPIFLAAVDEKRVTLYEAA